uniref:Uncharacterized protein n=1 Tax=Rhizophora mucronata TaxID=61149 RepID=A0A2P2M4L1_RHIMU
MTIIALMNYSKISKCLTLFNNYCNNLSKKIINRLAAVITQK